MTLTTALWEMWDSANMAFSLCPLLTQAAIDALERHASNEQKEIYLEKLVSGEWTGTMNLTEPQSGTDLGTIRTSSIKEDDHYRIKGQKIYITWGDHDMTENIIHLVLARSPDGPPGSRGLSLFIVPKFLINADGSLGQRNLIDRNTELLAYKFCFQLISRCPYVTNQYADQLFQQLHHPILKLILKLHAQLDVVVQNLNLNF